MIADEDDHRAFRACDIREFVDAAVCRRQPKIRRGRAELNGRGCCGHGAFSFAIVARMKRSAIRDGTVCPVEVPARETDATPADRAKPPYLGCARRECGRVSSLLEPASVDCCWKRCLLGPAQGKQASE